MRSQQWLVRGWARVHARAVGELALGNRTLNTDKVATVLSIRTGRPQHQATLAQRCRTHANDPGLHQPSQNRQHTARRSRQWGAGREHHPEQAHPSGTTVWAPGHGTRESSRRPCTLPNPGPAARGRGRVLQERGHTPRPKQLNLTKPDCHFARPTPYLSRPAPARIQPDREGKAKKRQSVFAL